jgi:hypothetical protein
MTMTAPRPDAPTTAPTPSRLRVPAAVSAALLLPAGAGLTLLAWLQADSGGYFDTGPHRFATATAALKTDEIEVGSSSARAGDPAPDLGEIARVKIVVRPADPRVPVFVGIGPKREVESYLARTAHDEFVSADLDPLRASFRRTPGSPSADDPAARTFWVASSSGTGARTLEWDKTRGAWSVVVMRLDGRPGVDVDASVGLRFGFLLPTGLAALTGGASLLALALRTRRRAA